MRDHTVSVDSSVDPAALSFAPVFNTAVVFIDRHLEEGRGDKIVIRTEAGEEVSYAELAAQVNRAGNVLKAQGLAPGDRLLIVVKDAPEFFYLFWGAIKAGFLPVPLNTLLRAKDYQFMITDSGCTGIVYSPEYASEVEPAIAAAEAKPRHILRTVADTGATDETLLGLMASASPELAPVATSPDDESFWLYSSGTTGPPKGTVHVHRDIAVTCVHYSTEVLGLNEDDVCFSAAKLFFAYGLGNAMTFPLWAGASTLLMPGAPTPDGTFDMIEKFKPTAFFGVPTLYAAQLRALEGKTRDLSSARLWISAGEALPSDILRRWKEYTGVDILDGIGSTEVLHIFISNRPGDVEPGTSGLIVPGYEARILDEDGKESKVGSSGQLMIKGASSAKLYWNNPEKTARTMVDGWIDTGDTYLQDAKGYFHYCGRNDDMLKVGGIWCSPFEIEAKLIEHPKVLEAAVVGRTDDNNLIKPAAYVVLNNPEDRSDATADDLLQHCKSGLAKYKYPRWIDFVDDLPKTATGKIQRFKLR